MPIVSIALASLGYLPLAPLGYLPLAPLGYLPLASLGYLPSLRWATCPSLRWATCPRFARRALLESTSACGSKRVEQVLMQALAARADPGAS